MGDTAAPIADFNDLPKVITLVDASGNKFSVSNPFQTALNNSPSSPAITESNLQSWVRAGNGFVVSQEQYTPAATANALSIFNPAASGKTLIVYSLLPRYDTAGTAVRIRLVNADPAFANALTMANFQVSNSLVNGGAASVASVTYATASTSPPAVSAASRPYVMTSNISNAPFDVLSWPSIIVLPPGNGVALYIQNAASGNLAFNGKWIEL